ncbi:hypothetical protein [Sorangium sp. So ce381]|uniref:hypothetical protein n=1 Tax=Sorangium sp. So ce381 TaxID=3133307 RepID=UPI003F5C1F70
MQRARCARCGALATITSAIAEPNTRAGILNFSAAATLDSGTDQRNRIDDQRQCEEKRQPFSFGCTKGQPRGRQRQPPLRPQLERVMPLVALAQALVQLGHVEGLAEDLHHPGLERHRAQQPRLDLGVGDKQGRIGTCQTSIRCASPAGTSTSVSAAPTRPKKSRRMFLPS